LFAREKEGKNTENRKFKYNSRSRGKKKKMINNQLVRRNNYGVEGVKRD